MASVVPVQMNPSSLFAALGVQVRRLLQAHLIAALGKLSTKIYHKKKIRIVCAQDNPARVDAVKQQFLQRIFLGAGPTRAASARMVLSPGGRQ
jgi:hypothetical protein